MANPVLQADLANLQSALAKSEALTMAVRSQASIPAMPHAPIAGLLAAAEALAAQQETLRKMHKLLEKMAK